MALNRLTDELARARRAARVLDPQPWRGAVTSIEDGYAVQTLLAGQPGHQVRGWKVTALTKEQQQLYGADKPVAGALLAPFFHAAPATLSIKDYVVPLLECEVAFLLGTDLPPRQQPYTREEIETAIEAVVPAMEIADCRWPEDAPGVMKLADSMGNGAFVVNARITDANYTDGMSNTVAFSEVKAYQGKLANSGTPSSRSTNTKRTATRMRPSRCPSAPR